MKKLALSFTILYSSLLCSAATINIGGTDYPVDTTEHYQAGPDTWYTRFRVRIGSTWRNCYLLQADLNNQYIQPEMHQGQDQFGKTQTLVSAYQSMDSAQHRVIGGVNTNFFWTANAHPGYFEGLLGCTVGGTAHNGVMIGNPDDWNRVPAMNDSGVGYVVIDENNRAYIDCMNYSGRIIIGEEDYPIWETNRYRNNPHADEIVLFNDYQADRPTRETTGTEIIFTTNEWNINGTMQCTVQSINHAGGTIIPANQGVLQGLGTGKTFLDRLQIGDTFQVQLDVYPVTNPEFRPSIKEMVSGNCFVMKDGELLPRNYESEPTMGTYNTNTYPRTMIATNQTHDKLYLLVAETSGLTTAQMCEILRHAGAAFAAGMDGGGSAQMCLFGSIKNRTTEANPRAVPASMWLITNAPDDSTVTRIAPTQSTVTLPKKGSYKPSFYCYNQYDVLLARNFQGATLTCDPSVGYIDTGGYFVCKDSGILHCEYKNASYDVQINAVPSIFWDIDPIAFHLGQLEVRWYGLLWAVGIMAAYGLQVYFYKKEKCPETWSDKLFTYMVIGVIVGARLGHCLFYEWEKAEPGHFLGYHNPYIEHPWELVKIWEGGLSSHGGAFGLITAAFILNKKHFHTGINWIFDRLVIGVCITAICIRLGNLMNSEIYGIPTDLPWGFTFARNDKTKSCHPTQIYEMLYCLVAFVVTMIIYLKGGYKRKGLIFGIFLIIIFLTRFCLEFIKNPQEAFESDLQLKMGQILSLPFIIWGIYLIVQAFIKPADTGKPIWEQEPVLNHQQRKQTKKK